MRIKLLILIILSILLTFPVTGYSQVPNLKTVSNFILFTSNGALTNTGATVTGGGDIGTNLGGITGFTGDKSMQHIQDPESQQCSLDLRDLYEEIRIIPVTRTLSDTDLPLRDTYTAGIYVINKAITLGITLTLDAQNNPDALFIFKINGAYSSAAGTKIILINGALPKNVYFSVEGAISFGAGAAMKGTFLSNTGAIDFAAGASLEGRALTNSGAVSLYENIVMNVFTQVPDYILIQPGIQQSTGTITILSPKERGMAYSIDGSNYANSTGIFNQVPPGTYIVTARDSAGCISAGSKLKILPFLNLGVNSEFAIFSRNGKIQNLSESTQVTGNIGSQIGGIDFSEGKICGQIYTNNSITRQADEDLVTLNRDLSTNVCDTTITTLFGNGQVLFPKVYCFGAALILTGDLTLDAQGDPTAIFIFRIGGAFKTATHSKVILKNGASMCNVYWQIIGAITIEEESEFRGNIVCTGAIIFEDGSSLQGRALSMTGAITLHNQVKVNILPSPSIVVIQPTNKVSTGTITIVAPTGADVTYSIDGKSHSNRTGIFTNVAQGTYTVTARNMECSSCPGTQVTIGQPVWTGSVSNAWNNESNWSPNSIPTAGQDIIIQNVPKSPVINLLKGITAVCNNMTIKQGASCTIFPGNILTVNGTVFNQAGTSGLVIKSSPIDEISNGTLIFNNSISDSLSATVEMYSKASWDKTQVAGSVYKWQFFGIPLRSVKADPTFAGAYVRRAYESGSPTTPSWVQLQNESVLTSFTGYEIVQKNPTIYTFTGFLENRSLKKTVAYTEGAYYPGQHLIVNPYTAAIDITKLSFGSAMEESIYLYNTGSLNDWKNSKAMIYDQAAINPGQYTVSTKQTAGKAAGIPGQIPSMQAFLVKANNNSIDATLDIPYSSVAIKNDVKQSAPGIKGLKPENTTVFTRIDVKGSRFADRMWIFTDAGCSHNFDNGWDGRKFIGSSLTPQIFAMEEDEYYQINAVDDINNSYLGFLAGEDSNYAITFTHENIQTYYSGIYLQDLKENKVVDISTGGTIYSFEANKTDSLKRFKILTFPVITALDETNMPFRIFNSKETIFIHNFSNVGGDISIYDMTGRFRQKLIFEPTKITVLKTSLPAGAYIIRAKTSSGQELKKLVLI